MNQGSLDVIIAPVGHMTVIVGVVAFLRKEPQMSQVNSKICVGRFKGGEVEPGTFHKARCGQVLQLNTGNGDRKKGATEDNSDAESN